MKITLHTKDGIFEREATQEEIETLAKANGIEAKTEILKSDISKAVTTDEKVNKILEFLGI